jgi:MFS family permease
MNRPFIMKRAGVAVLDQPLFLASFSFIFLMFGLPIFAKALGASALEIGALYAIFTGTITVLRPVFGRALDRFGRRRFLIVAMLGYAAAMGLYASARTLAGLGLARAVEGAAAACLWTSARTIAADLSPSGDRGRAMGRMHEMFMRGGMIGVLMGFMLVSLLPKGTGWRSAFTGYAVLAALGGWRVCRSLPETSLPAGAFAVGKRVPLSRTLLSLLALVFVTGLSAAMLSPIYLIFLQDRFTTNIFTLGWAFLPAGVVASVLPSHAGRLSDRVGRSPLMTSGLIGTGLLSLLLPHLPGISWLILVYTLSAACWAMAEPAEAAMVADLTGGESRGAVYGLYEFARGAGTALGPLLGGWLYDAVGQATPFYLNGLVLCLGAVGVWRLLKKPFRKG